jgi:hypothetical protein
LILTGQIPGALSDLLFATAVDSKPGALTWVERKPNNSLLNWPPQWQLLLLNSSHPNTWAKLPDPMDVTTVMSDPIKQHHEGALLALMSIAGCAQYVGKGKAPPPVVTKS